MSPPTPSDDNPPVVAPMPPKIVEAPRLIAANNAFEAAPVEQEIAITPTIEVLNGTDSLADNPTIPSRPTFTGKATPGTQVKVTVHSDPVICETTADANGDWSCTLDQDLPDGKHTVYVSLTSPDGTVTELGPYAVTVGETITNDSKPVGDTSEAIEDKSEFPFIPVAIAGLVLLAAMAYVVRRLTRNS